MRGDSLDFANDIRSARERDTPYLVVVLMVLLLALAAGLGTWAHFAILDEVTNAMGEVVPESKLQVIQSLEGGIVEEILVTEGEVVKAGQVLIRIDSTNFGSQLGELSERRLTGLAQLARLEAESEGREGIGFPEELAAAAPAAVAAEQALFDARRAQLERDLDVFARQSEQAEQELRELAARRDTLTEGLRLLERELALSRDLRKRRALPELELLKTERETAEARGELEVIGASEARVSAELSEIASRMSSAKAKFAAEARAELAEVTGSLAVLGEALSGARDKVTRTALRSPTDGVVNTLNVTTQGGVVKPGEPILEIVPIGDSLLVEARVRPQDIAFIRPAQPASVKLTAYDYTVYGALDGTVDQISPNTVTDTEGNVFYRVMVRTEENGISRDDEVLPVIPGMIATVDILTGRKSVLEYLLKPMQRMRNEALRER